MIVTVTTPSQTLTAESSLIFRFMTPHSCERFECDRHPTVLTLAEFRRHLAAGLTLVIGDHSYTIAHKT